MSGELLNIRITGKLPTINTDFEPAFGQIVDLMFRSVQQNFIVGGRPNQWPPLQLDSAVAEASHLYRSGFMFESIQMEHDALHAKVSIDTVRVPYARIHNDGGVIQHPGSSKFQAFYFNGAWVYTHGTKAHAIPMPQREFMMFQEADRTQIKEILSTAILFQN